jgi:hypothetical protein
MDRKASVVLEHIIQASVISHTMQDFDTFQKWNECLFLERFMAFMEGNELNDPVLGWYEGEFAFFDNVVLPMTERLKQCGILGIDGIELMERSTENRENWVLEGESLVEKYHGRAKDQYTLPSGATAAPAPKARRGSYRRIN